MAATWQHYGRNMAALWPHYGRNMAATWPHYDTHHDTHQCEPQSGSFQHTHTSVRAFTKRHTLTTVYGA